MTDSAPPALADLPALPVADVLGEVASALREHGTAVLVAPPGTGKTTLVPLALARSLPGKVVVAEPRRLAARAAASRMAALLGEDVGETAGYSVRGDSRTSERTRVEVVTSGLLVRRLQHDPELRGVSVVVLDECHERQLDADLLLTLLLDARAGLREDLRLLATSATVAFDRLSSLLDGAPVVTARATTFPVEVTHRPPARGERIESCVARTILTGLSEHEGDVLAFLPGVAEIERVARQLDPAEAEVVILHGRLSSARQDAALRSGRRRRVVLATAVAESSLTVPGVRIVVDSGLARTPRVDHRRGLSRLETVRGSRAVAEQRAGRAGREGPGVVYRCWRADEHAGLPDYPEPEIRTAELSRLALELACWSTPDGSGLRWWDPPPEGALSAGRSLLRNLGAVDDTGQPTDRGRRMATLGLHPRLGRALLDGAARVGAESAAEVVALLDLGSAATNLDTALSHLRRADDQAAHRWRREVRRLTRLVAEHRGSARPDPATVVALAYPERVARRRPGDDAVYLLASGTAVTLPPDGGLGDAEWLAVAEATRQSGRAHGVVRLAAAADENVVTTAAAALLSEDEEIRWSDSGLVTRRVRRLGAITLSEHELADPAPARVRDAVRDGLRAGGLRLLSWSTDATCLRQRLAFLHDVFGPPWPDVSDTALLARVDDWLGPELPTVRRRTDLARIDTATALRRLLPWPEAARFDDLAPDRLPVPTGSRPRVDYSGDEPVLAVKLQETFGWRSTPRIADGAVPVVLHLLSPAGRPAAVTADLESFWRQGYPAVRAELRGRYPKHPWPEDPWTAEPTRRTTRRR